MTQQPLRVPEREITSKPRCDMPVQGDGVMSYHCSLPIDHQQDTLDKGDPQPCYTIESNSSRRLWSAWKIREEQRRARAEEPEHIIACPRCTKATMVVDHDKGLGECTNCGEKASFQTDHTEPPISLADAEQPGEPWRVLREGGRAVGVRVHNYADFQCTEREETMAGSEKQRCIVCRPLTEDEMDAFLRGERPEGVPDIPGLTAPLTGIASVLNGPEFDRPGWKAEPTKQREGDQRLPAGGDRVVQDWVIGQAQQALERSEISVEDCQIVIDTMRESKRVGTERYGQPLKTFDGRLNIKDLAEELRDAYVYASKLQMMAEADRETLVRSTIRRLKRIEQEWGPEMMTHEKIAEEVVDNILDWVLTQRIGPEQVLPVVEP